MTNEPITREELYLAKVAGDGVVLPDHPITRKERYLDRIAKNGGGGSGGADLAWKKIATVSASSAANEYVLTVDASGNPFSYKEIAISFIPQLSGYFYVRASANYNASLPVQFWVTNGKETHITLGLFDGKLALSSVCRTDGAVGYTGSGGGNTAFDSVTYLLFGASAGFTAAQNINIFGR